MKQRRNFNNFKQQKKQKNHYKRQHIDEIPQFKIVQVNRTRTSEWLSFDVLPINPREARNNQSFRNNMHNYHNNSPWPPLREKSERRGHPPQPALQSHPLNIPLQQQHQQQIPPIFHHPYGRDRKEEQYVGSSGGSDGGSGSGHSCNNDGSFAPPRFMIQESWKLKKQQQHQNEMEFQTSSKYCPRPHHFREKFSFSSSTKHNPHAYHHPSQDHQYHELAKNFSQFGLHGDHHSNECFQFHNYRTIPKCQRPLETFRRKEQHLSPLHMEFASSATLYTNFDFNSDFDHPKYGYSTLDHQVPWPAVSDVRKLQAKTKICRKKERNEDSLFSHTPHNISIRNRRILVIL